MRNTAIKRCGLPLLALGAALALMLLTVRPYGWKVSALFHMDARLAASEHLSSNIVILDEPAYDGAQYYLIARKFGQILAPSSWSTVASELPGAYAYQRILLPALAWTLATGHDAALPYAFVLIQVLCITGIFTVTLRATRSVLAACALAFCPAATLGLHFMLAEPLSLLLTTLILTRYIRMDRIDGVTITLCAALVLTREVNILFIGFLGLTSIVRRHWRDMFFLIVPCIVFGVWHGMIYLIFHDLPFLWSVEKNAPPFMTPLLLLSGDYGYDIKTLSAIALLLGVVVPTFVGEVSAIIRRRSIDVLGAGTLCFLLVMLAMPDHIWGSITSIGRVITPVYPLMVLHASTKPYAWSRIVLLGILGLGIGVGIGLALIIHPTLTSL